MVVHESRETEAIETPDHRIAINAKVLSTLQSQRFHRTLNVTDRGNKKSNVACNVPQCVSVLAIRGNKACEL